MHLRQIRFARLGALLCLAAAPRPAAAQLPPTTTFSILSSYVSTNTLREQLVLCAASGMTIDSVRMTLNGTSVTSHFAAGGSGTCPGGISPLLDTGTVSPAFGKNDLQVYACAWDGRFTDPHYCGPTDYDFHHTYVEVTPKGTAVSGHVSEATTQQFQVQNLLSTTQTFNLAVICSGAGVSGCSVPSKTSPVAGNATTPVTVNFTAGALNSTGTITLVATDSATTGAVDTGSVAYTAKWLTPETISTAYTNQEDQDLSRCAMNCFALRTSMSTAPYISRDAANAVTLMYNSDQMAVRPVLYADVKVASTTYTLQGFQFSAQYYDPINSVWVHITFLNGDQNLKFAAVSDTVMHRLAGQFDASGLATNHGQAVYQLLMQVVTTYSDHADTLIDSTHHLVLVNGRGSAVAHGWSIVGPGVNNWCATNIGGLPCQNYIMRVGGDGSAQLYGPAACFPGGCNWSAGALGLFAFLHYTSTTGESNLFPDSTRELTSPAGYFTATIFGPSDTVYYGYDGSNRVISISDPYRMQPSPNNTQHTYWEINYGTNGISSIVEPDSVGHPGMGRTTTISVDANGLLRSWTDPDGVATKFGYDSHNRLDTLYDRKGHTTTFAYDSLSWKLTRITSPSVPIDSSGTGSPSSQTIVEALTPWQTIGVPINSTSGTPATAVLVSSVIAADSTAAGKTTFTADQWGQPLVLRDPLGDTTRFAYDFNGFDATVTYASGAVDTFDHDFGPFLVKSTPAGLSETDYQYGPWGQITQISGSGQPTQTFYVNANGHTDSAKVSGSTWRYYADAYGRDTLDLDAQHDTTKFRYDARTGNLDSTISWPSYRFTALTFDGHGRVRTQSVSAPTGAIVVTTTAYDSVNRVVSSTDGLHATPVKFTYDSLFNTAISDPLGQTYHYAYNALGWDTTETDTTSRTVRATYNNLGLPTTATNRRSHRIQTLYDHYGRDSIVTRPDTGFDRVDYFRYPDVYTVFDSNAVVTDTTYIDHTTGFIDAVVTLFNTTGHWFKRTYTHDALGRVTKMAITTNDSANFDFYSRAIGYNASTGLIDSVDLRSSSNRLTFAYDSLFRLTTVNYPGGTTRSDSYANIGALLSTTWTALGLARTYGYDSTGRVSEVDYNGMLKGDSLSLYTYDKLGELTQNELHVRTETLTTCPGHQIDGDGCHEGPSPGDSLIWQANYSYDAAGSLDTVKVGTADTIATLSPANRLTAWTGMTFAVDSDGNRTSQTVGSTTTTYTWGADGRLLKVTQGSNTRSYDYDANGQLAQRQTNGKVDRYYLWDNGQILAILDSTATGRIAEFVYFGGADQPLARISGPKGSSTVHYYAQDVSGNVIGQFSGTTLEQVMKYDPWGATTLVRGGGDTTTAHLRWKGLLWEDGITSLYYMRARWYDPATRRFVSPDPLGLSAGVNQYAFANGDPVDGSDPSGLVCKFMYQEQVSMGGYTWCQNTSYVFCPSCSSMPLLPNLPNTDGLPNGNGNTGSLGGGGGEAANFDPNKSVNPIQKCLVNAGAVAISAGSDALFFTGIGAELKAARGLSKLTVALSAKATESIGWQAVRFNTNAAVARTMLRGGLNLAKIGGQGAAVGAWTGEPYGWGDFALDAVLDFLPIVGTVRAGLDMLQSCSVVVKGFVQ